MSDNTPPNPATARASAQAPYMVGGIMFGLLVLVFALPSFIIVAAGMIPTVLARALPATPDQKRGALAVAMLNFAGVLPVLAMLWSRGHNFNNAMQLLGEPLPWMLMLGAAAIAVMLQNVLPNVAISVMERAAQQRVHKLKAQQRELISEWGGGVQGATEPKGSSTQPGPKPGPKTGIGPGSGSQEKDRPHEIGGAGRPSP